MRVGVLEGSNTVWRRVTARNTEEIWWRSGISTVLTIFPSGGQKVFWKEAETSRCAQASVDILARTVLRQTVWHSDSVARDASARRSRRTFPRTSTLGVSQVRLGLDSSSSYTRNQSGQLRFGPVRDEPIRPIRDEFKINMGSMGRVGRGFNKGCPWRVFENEVAHGF